MTNVKYQMMNEIKDKKIAIVHEELTQLGGAERLLDIVLEMFPGSPVYTIVWDRSKTNHKYDRFDIRPSFIQKLPGGVKHYKWYLALMPRAIESFDLREFDIIISITSALVKGVKTRENQLHICYCNTPTRYLWVDSDEYIKHAPIPGIIRPLMPGVIKYLKRWDLTAAKRPDYIISNSENVQRRVKKIYHRDSAVIYPTIDFKKFKTLPKKDFFLLVSRLQPYKKVEMVLEAFKNIPDKLVVVGTGIIEKELKAKATPNVCFAGRVTEPELLKLYAEAKGFIFPQEEDFGLTPVEAMASGTPIIAYKAGGALETVQEGQTGTFFFPQTAEALKKAIASFSAQKYDPTVLRRQAQKFDNSVFKQQLLEYTEGKLKVKSQMSNNY